MAGAQCCANPPDLSSAGTGCTMETMGGLQVYTAGSPDSKHAIIFVSDIFGFPAPNLRKFADRAAAAGFFVVVPDFFYGDPYVADKQPLETWLQAHGTDKGFEDAKVIVAALKDKGICEIGAAGYCWGGKVVVKLAKSGDIKAGVMLHPAFLTEDDFKEVKAPLAVLGAEFDHVFPAELLKQYGEVLSENSEVESYVKIFPGVEHGWSIRYDINDEEAVKKAEEAYQDMMQWFVKHLK